MTCFLILPSSKKMTLSPQHSRSQLWVTITIVIGFNFCSRSQLLEYPKLFIYKSKFMTSIVDFESRSPVGSSSKMIDGEFANDLAMALNYDNITLFAASLLIANQANALLFKIVLHVLKAFLFSISFIFLSFFLLFSSEVKYFNRLTSMPIN